MVAFDNRATTTATSNEEKSYLSLAHTHTRTRRPHIHRCKYQMSANTLRFRLCACDARARTLHTFITRSATNGEIVFVVFVCDEFISFSFLFAHSKWTARICDRQTQPWQLMHPTTTTTGSSSYAKTEDHGISVATRAIRLPFSNSFRLTFHVESESVCVRGVRTGKNSCRFDTWCLSRVDTWCLLLPFVHFAACVFLPILSLSSTTTTSTAMMIIIICNCCWYAGNCNSWLLCIIH